MTPKEIEKALEEASDLKIGNVVSCKDILNYIKWLKDGNNRLMEMVTERTSELGELRSKIRNGTLVEMPCEMGDTVYCVCKDNYDNSPYFIREAKCNGIGYYGKRKFIIKTELYRDGEWYYEDEEYIGTFATLKEAKRCIRRYKNDNN